MEYSFQYAEKMLVGLDMCAPNNTHTDTHTQLAHAKSSLE